MASITERGGKFWVRWREGSKDRSRTVRSKREAERLAGRIEDALERGERPGEPRRVRSVTALSDVLRDYVADCDRRNAKATTYKVARILEGFRRWSGPAGVDALSWASLSAYHRHLVEHGRHGHPRQASTVFKHFAAIEGMWEFAWKRQARGVYQGVPQPDSLDLRAPLPARRPAPSWTDMDAVIAAASGWQRELYTVLRCTGLRVQQAMGLTWDDVDLDLAQLRIRPELGKSKSEKRGRWVPLAPALVDELAGWGRRTGPLVRCGRAQRVARARDAARAWERAGVPSELWSHSPHHAFRRGFKSGLARLGVSKEARDYLVGHSAGVDEHYLDPSALPLVEAVGKVPPMPSRVRRVYTVSRGSER